MESWRQQHVMDSSNWPSESSISRTISRHHKLSGMAVRPFTHLGFSIWLAFFSEKWTLVAYSLHSFSLRKWWNDIQKTPKGTSNLFPLVEPVDTHKQN
jgi:hypothetical protein